MRVRLKTSRAGHGFRQAAGDTIDLPADEARRLIDNRWAEPIETASECPPQNAAGRRRPTKSPQRGE